MKKIHISALAFASVFLFACTEDITKEIQDKLDSSETKLVVEGAFCDDTLAHTVRLSKSADYFANKPLEPVSGANVTISDGTVAFQLSEEVGKPGVYRTSPDVYGIAGNTYQLLIEDVDIDGNGITETYSASGRINPMGAVDSIQVKYKNLFYQDMWEVNFYAQEPGESRDCYLFRTWKNGVLVKDSLFEASLSDDELINGIYCDGMTVQYFDGEKPDERLVKGDTIMLEVQGITKEYYQFFYDLMLESQGSDPFGGQPANVSTNLSGGAIGFFNTYTIKRVSAIYDGN